MARITRIALDVALGAAQTLKRAGSQTWPYLKVEAIPPLTSSFFNGPAGRKLENFADKTLNGLIGNLSSKIKKLDEDAITFAKAKEAAAWAEVQYQKTAAETERRQKAAKADAKAAEEAKAKKPEAKAAPKAADKPKKDEKHSCKLKRKKRKAKIRKGKGIPKPSPKSKKPPFCK